jgi:cation diffusion facilitator CzcD-associated flavoprotein CzcO
MNVQSQIRASAPTTTEHFDVLIAGAGISGVGAAYHLTTQCPGTSFVALETQKTFGGTWSTHRYPGIRSDSDLHTFGYRFKPWTSAPIASAAEILKYMGEVIEENDLARHIRYHHTIISAKWSSEKNLWTIEATRGDTGETVRFTTNFFWMCQGYYRHTQGYTPEWKDMARFKGPIIHPQKWPEDLDYNNKRIVVIGSGATAATLIPALAKDCAHVTMLQRSPTYFRTHEITRRKILFDQDAFTRKTFEEPEAAKKDLLSAVEAYLGKDYDIKTHFTPTYRPWRQRIAFIPDGDLFQGIKSGKASVVTDEIDRFTEKGILLKSGNELEADIIITATGFNLSANGDRDLSRHDVHRRAQPRLGIRLFPRQLDAARRPRRRLRLQAAQSHEANRRQEGDAGAAAGRPQHAAAAMDRSGELQSGLHDARHAPAAEARRQAGMAAQPGLLGREGPISGDRYEGPRVRVRLARSVA